MGARILTVGELLNNCRESNAACLKITVRNADNEPLWAVIIVDGTPETREILEAVERIEKSWE